MDEIEVVEVLGVEIAEEVHDHVCRAYPWLPTRMDFSRIPDHQHIYWGQVSDERVAELLSRCSLRRFEHVACLTSPERPLPVLRFSDVVTRLWWVSPGEHAFLLFGASGGAGRWTVDKDAFLYAHPGRDIWIHGGER